MKTLLQVYNDNPAVYIQMAEQANKEQKVLSVKNDALFLEDIPLPDSADTIRNVRNEKLAQTDWTQLSDVKITKEQQEKWKIYRQKLRDLPMQSGFPKNVEWPEQP